MKRKIDLEKLIQLKEKSEYLKGTDCWHHYHMQYESKMPNGRWAFIGWYVPYSLNKDYIVDCYIKTFKNNEYLYIEYRNGPDRWLLTESVKKALEI
ncbi:MAG: hypothetical protein IJF87_06125 [Erysipelotrichaceae bacterium]|nr:hypothetical protein [Erysipelotrichaceae bacterium]